jgi:hypothetical protein
MKIYTAPLHGNITTDVKKKRGGGTVTVEMFHSNVTSNPDAEREGRH